MSEEDALLAAIAAHPAEDTPRLAYADWLDEHGRHVRAEFIRIQIEIAQKETLPRVLQNRYVDVWKRNQELLDDRRDELLGPLGGLGNSVKAEFRRGFVSELTLGCDLFNGLTGAIRGLRPVPQVIVEDEVWAVRRFLGRGEPHAPRDLVSALRTRENKGGDDELLGALLELASRGIYQHVWSRLNELDVSGCRLGVDNVVALLRIEMFPALYDLDLSVNDLTDTVVMPLLRSGLPRQLKRLILGGNPISDFGARLLAEQWPTGADDRLEHLNLKFTAIGQPGQQALLRRFGGRIDLF
jgi:uncharacterized protein (TIGR02996 family)